MGAVKRKLSFLLLLFFYLFESDDSDNLFLLSLRCVICRLDYEDGDNLILLSCKHSYHSECITNWLQINKVNELDFLYVWSLKMIGGCKNLNTLWETVDFLAKFVCFLYLFGLFEI